MADPSGAATEEQSRAKKFIDSIARRSMEVPTDFLDTIKEEKNEQKPAVAPSLQIEKKYPFNRYSEKTGSELFYFIHATFLLFLEPPRPTVSENI